MTYIELVNKVLRRLREKTVTTFANDYPQLIGEFVNEAKEEVESAWKWKCLRTKVTFPTVAGTVEYNIGTGGVGSTATNERSQLLYEEATDLPLAFNETEDNRLIEVPLAETQSYRSTDQLAAQARPCTFSVSKSRTGLTVVMYPPPDGVYTIALYCLIPQAPLSATTDVITVPGEPVWRAALAMAEEERGTGLGARAEALGMRAKACLADYIMRDSEEMELMLRPL